MRKAQKSQNPQSDPKPQNQLQAQAVTSVPLRVVRVEDLGSRSEDLLKLEKACPRSLRRAKLPAGVEKHKHPVVWALATDLPSRYQIRDLQYMLWFTYK